VLPPLGFDPLPRLATLYRCEAPTTPDTPYGSYPLIVSAVAASDANGAELPGVVAGTGAVVVLERFPVTIVVGTARGLPGARVAVEVMLDAEVEVAGTQNDLVFTPQARIAPNAVNRPSCRPNSEIALGGSAFSFHPPGCTPGVDCSAVRALVLTFSNTTPLPDMLYQCDVLIALDAPPGEYPLRVSGPGASDRNGVAVFTDGSDGAVLVAAPPATVTATPVPSATATATEVSSPTPPPTPTRGNGGDGSCAVASGTHVSAWMLLAPLLIVGIVSLRRWIGEASIRKRSRCAAAISHLAFAIAAVVSR
jgi:hypothetical protein